MIKSLMTWLFGPAPSSKKEAEAPYKLEQPQQDIMTGIIVPTTSSDVPVTAPVTTAVLEVKPKFKKADLEKKSKAELLALAQERGLDVKARTVKAELVKALMKS